MIIPLQYSATIYYTFQHLSLSHIVFNCLGNLKLHNTAMIKLKKKKQEIITQINLIDDVR
jgi:membrane associated rhomboid family serine protease